MTYRALITISGLIVCAAGTAGAQATVAPATHELAPVTVIAPSHGAVYRIAHIEEQRQYVLGLMDENRRLGADLRRADAKVAQLEGRLLEAKADRDRRVAGIAAIDSAAAETRRMRLELEEKLRRLEPATQDQGSGSR